MFKKDFLFGFSLAGFQSEMGISDVDNASDWWKWVHDLDNISSGLVSGDFPEHGIGYWDLYEKYNGKAAEMGLNAARLGIEWSRIFPNTTDEIKVYTEMNENDIVNIAITDDTLKQLDEIANQEAVTHYRNIFENVINNGMELIINIYHWPIPLYLHDPIKSRNNGLKNEDNGWLNHRTIIEFVKYAAYVTWKFQDLAERFSIMNEPNVVAGGYYAKSGFPPSFPSVKASLLAKKHLIEAIGRSYDAMKKLTNKPIGFIYANSDIQPLDPKDESVAEKAKEDERYSFLDPLFSGNMSWFHNQYLSGRIDEDTNPVREDLRKRFDWIGVNYYTRMVIQKNGNGYSYLSGYGHLATAGLPSADNREVSDYGWEVYPEGLYNVLMQYHKRYGLPMIVTENGVADSRDIIRPRYLVSHLASVERAIADGANVLGYLHWSLYDNYEWASGFKMKFGLIGINLRDKSLELRPSALIYEKIAKSKRIPEEFRWMATSISSRS